jgi:hypothetical protein
MTNLSDLFPAGAGKQVSFTAAETIGAGKIVQVKTDGQIELPQTTGDLTGQVGTAGYIEGNKADNCAMDYDTDENRYLAVVVNANGNIEGYTGTASGLEITWSSKGEIINPSGTSAPQGLICRFMPTLGLFLIAFRDQGSSNYLGCCYGEMAADGSISASGIVHLSTAVAADFSAAEHVGEGIPILQYQNGSGYPYVVALGESGGSPTFGTELALTSTVAAYFGRWAAAYDPDRARIISTYATSTGLYAVEVDVTSGGVVSKGTTSSELKTTANADECNLAYDTVNDKMLYAFKDDANSSYGTCFVLSNSSGTFSAGTSVVFNSGSTPVISPAYTTGVIVLAFESDATAIEGTGVTISGTTVTSWTPVTLDAIRGDSINTIYDPDTAKVYVAYSCPADTSARDVGLTPGGSTTTDYIGVSEESISSAASGNVTLKGGILTSGVSGLTPGVDYYGQSDGSISTTSTSPAVKIGKALSATSINLEYQS